MVQPRAATEQMLPDLVGFDTWSDARILDTLLAGQRRALDAVERALPALSSAAEKIAACIASGGKLIYAGAGTSIRIAVQDGSELPATFGMKDEQIAYLIAGGRAAIFETLADAEDDAATGAADAGICSEKDCLIAIAASGRTPYTIAAAQTARSNGAYVIAVVNNAGSPLAAVANMEVRLESGPEVISGSTRLGAGTAQKAALNLLSTLVHVKLGAVHDGLMVNVEAGNSKLVTRATNIIGAVSGSDPQTSAHALKATQGRVKEAILLLAGADDVHAAQQLLSDSNGNLRVALASLKVQV